MSSLRSIVAALIAGTNLAVSMPAMSQAGDNATLGVPDSCVAYGNRCIVNNTQNSNIRNGKRTSGDSADSTQQPNVVTGNRIVRPTVRR